MLRPLLFLALAATSARAQWILTSPHNITDLEAGGGHAVSVGWNSGGIRSSPDGINWNLLADQSARAVCFGDGYFWIVANSNELLRTNGTSAPVPMSAGLFAADIAYGNGRLVIPRTFPAGIAYSTNGIDWTTALVPADVNDSEAHVAFLGNIFIVTSSPNLLTSADGAVWTIRASDIFSPPRSVAFGNGRFIAISRDGQKRWNSLDGITWTLIPGAVGHSVNALHFVNGSFLAVGSNGKISASSDGSTWSPQSSGVTFTLEAITSLNGLALSGGTQLIRAATPAPQATLPINIRSAIELEFQAADSVLYRIEGSTDLSSWTPVETHIVGHGEPIKRFYSTTGQPHRYFRAVTE